MFLSWPPLLAVIDVVGPGTVPYPLYPPYTQSSILQSNTMRYIILILILACSGSIQPSRTEQDGSEQDPSERIIGENERFGDPEKNVDYGLKFGGTERERSELYGSEQINGDNGRFGDPENDVEYNSRFGGTQQDRSEQEDPLERINGDSKGFDDPENVLEYGGTEEIAVERRRRSAASCSQDKLRDLKSEQKVSTNS